MTIIIYEVKIMIIDVLPASVMMVLFVFSLFVSAGGKSKAIKIPKDHRDTSEARYAINERGYLEEIRHDKLSSRAQ